MGDKNLEETLFIIKPDAMGAGFERKILARIREEGFEIVATEHLRLSKSEAEGFYTVHKGKEFYAGLVEFMTSGMILVCRLRRENAIKRLREVVGATNPENAEEGTIRKEFGTTVCHNAVHASDSPENAKTEIAFFFR